MKTTSLDIQFTKRFSTNLVSNLIYFILNILIGLVLVPFFLDTLGTVAYGLIPLATSITGYITIVIDSLNTSISRYLTIDLQRSDTKRANETYNTALFGTLGIIILVSPIAIGAAWYAPEFFNIGDVASTDVFLLFALIFLSVLIRAWGSSPMAVLFAHNRLDLRNHVNIVNIGTQLILVVSLFMLFGPTLVLVGGSYLGGALLSVTYAFFLSKRTNPTLSMSLLFFSGSRFREIGGMSAWVLINSVSLLLNNQIALLIVNKFHGEIAGTEFSLAIVWSTLLITIASQITNLFVPMTYYYYAKDDINGLKGFTSSTLKGVGLFMALPIAFVCVASAPLLTLWVGADFAHLSPLIWICVAPVILKVMVSCISPITLVFDRVKSLVMMTLPLGVLNVILALLIPEILNNGIYGVAMAGMITLLIRYGLVNPLFIAHVIKLPMFTYLWQMSYGIGGLLLLSSLGLLFISVFSTAALLPLVVFFTVLGAVYLVVSIKSILQPHERNLMWACLPQMLIKKVPQWLL